MSDVIIHSEGLGKSYVIGHEVQREKYTTLRDVMARQIRATWKSTRRAWQNGSLIAGQEIEEFWALRDISFEVKRGEVIGVIGRNGAGKSTLLKILSRITEPTAGRVTLRGRVASLLEVGTGFHPELTGRENVFLNGAILGMTRAEIRRKFDEIVSFADIEKFLDTPVKRFSSGMYVRLAFAVAAHLEPEILVVDEVLAVGDMEFQRRCLGKMKDVATSGRTVLFVSHQLDSILNLCEKCLLLNSGRVSDFDDAESVVAKYRSIVSTNSHISLANRSDRKGSGRARFTELQIDNPDTGLPAISAYGPVRFRLHYLTQKDEPGFTGSFILAIKDQFGRPVSSLNTRFTVGTFPVRERGIVECRVSRLPLAGGRYTVDACVFEGVNVINRKNVIADRVDGAGEFHVCDDTFFCNGQRQDTRNGGSVLVEQQWQAVQ